MSSSVQMLTPELFTPGEPIAKLLIDPFVEQRLGLGLIEDAKVRIEPGLDRVGPEQRPAERMDRADPGALQLANRAEPGFDLFFRGVQQPAGAGGADPLSHFSGGTLGKRDRGELMEP